MSDRGFVDQNLPQHLAQRTNSTLIIRHRPGEQNAEDVLPKVSYSS
jgi:hypothetical protein